MSKSGDAPRVAASKFRFRKEMKHGCAHLGTKFFNWLESWKVVFASRRGDGDAKLGCGS